MQHFIHRIAIPNPFFEGRNSVYLIKCDPLTLVDTGVATEKAFEFLVAGLESVGVDVAEIRRVLLTHKHIDHIGNAWRIQQLSGADVFIHASETKSLTDVDPSGRRFADLVATRLEAWGVPAAERPQSSGNKMPQWQLEACTPTELPPSLECRFADVESSRPSDSQLEVIPTPGHTMGSVCFRLGDTIFSGDHVLENISPNIGGGDMRSRGMLARFLDSLTRVEGLGDLQIYPGHGKPFRGLQERCRKLSRHHEIRLKQAQKAVESGKTTVYEIALALYGRLNDFHTVLGCAEANAHLELLADQQAIVQDGVLFVPR